MEDPSVPPLSVELWRIPKSSETGPASSLTPRPTCRMSRVTCSKYVIKMCPRRRVYEGARGLSRAVKNCQSTASQNSPCCPGAASVSAGLTAQQRRLLWQLSRIRGVGGVGWGGGCQSSGVSVCYYNGWGGWTSVSRGIGLTQSCESWKGISEEDMALL